MQFKVLSDCAKDEVNNVFGDSVLGYFKLRVRTKKMDKNGLCCRSSKGFKHPQEHGCNTGGGYPVLQLGKEIKHGRRAWMITTDKITDNVHGMISTDHRIKHCHKAGISLSHACVVVHKKCTMTKWPTFYSTF